MVSKALQRALNEIRASGAQGVPYESEIQDAKDGTVWHGKKLSGGDWELTKNSEDNYSCKC